VVAGLKVELDVVSAEIERRTKEADFRLQQENRLVPYMYLAVVGIAGLFLKVDQITQAYEFLTKNPVWILVCSLLLMWFPIYSVIALTDQAKSMIYVRDALIPLRNHLLAQQRAILGITIPAPLSAAYEWGARGRSRLVLGPLDVGITLVIAPLAWFRFLLVALPPIVLFVSYFFARGAAVAAGTFDVQWWVEALIFAVMAGLIVLMVLAALTWTLKHARLRSVEVAHDSAPRHG
jgi:hypothetical protein